MVPVVSDRFFRLGIRDWIRGYRGLYAENLDAIQGLATLKAFHASRRRGEQLARRPSNPVTTPGRTTKLDESTASFSPHLLPITP